MAAPPFYEYKIGATWVGLANVEELATPLPAPKHSWVDTSVTVPLASGGVRGGGWPVATWHWGYLTTAQRNYLRSQFCASPAKSAEVYIQTKADDESYATYKAELVWPDEEDKRAGRVIDFTLRFQNIEVYP